MMSKSGPFKQIQELRPDSDGTFQHSVVQGRKNSVSLRQPDLKELVPGRVSSKAREKPCLTKTKNVQEVCLQDVLNSTLEAKSVLVYNILISFYINM